MLRFLLWIVFFIIVWMFVNAFVKNFLAGLRGPSAPDRRPPGQQSAGRPAPKIGTDIQDADFYDVDDRREKNDKG